VQIRRFALGAVLVLVTAGAGACGDDGQSDEAGDAAGAPTTTSTSTSTTTTSTIAVTTTVAPTTTAPPVVTTTPAPVATTRVPPPVATTSPPPPPGPPYEASIAAIDDATLARMTHSWRLDCPTPIRDLRLLTIRHWNDAGAVATGELIVHADAANAMVRAFGRLYDARFPIARMQLVDVYQGDDQASMRANNTSAFNCRTVAGTDRWSEHAYGRAVDVNPLVNPWVRGSTVDPPEGRPYADRNNRVPGGIYAGDAAVRAFTAEGWTWGGTWSGSKDYQHFSASGR
jgi:hypothetical protein